MQMRLVGAALGSLLLPAALWVHSNRAQSSEQPLRELPPAQAGAPARPLSADSVRLIAREFSEGVRLLRENEAARGMEVMERLTLRVPAIAGWSATLAAEEVATSGDTARVRRLLQQPAELPSWLRARRAELQAQKAARDWHGLRSRALNSLPGAPYAASRAEFYLWAAIAERELGLLDEARSHLTQALETAPATSVAQEAAEMRVELGSLSGSEQLKIARVHEARGNRPRALVRLQAAMEAEGLPEEERRQARLARGRLLFQGGDYAGAVRLLEPLYEAGPEVGPEALYWAGRARHRQGNGEAGRTLLSRAGRSYPGSHFGARGLFLQADLDHDAGRMSQAREGYQQLVASFPEGERTAEAATRLGSLLFLEGRFREAAGIWDRYRRSLPERGSGWAQATYWAGRSFLEAGETEEASKRFREVWQEEPISYYAYLASERLDERWPATLQEAPRTPAQARARVQRAMETVDILRLAELPNLLSLEVNRHLEASREEPELLYELGEALHERERELSPQGIRVGKALERGGATYNRRLLHILYPLPFRQTIEREAKRRGLDPAVVAALMRQESAFHETARSRVGARGLMQVMPATGAGLASSLGISNWSTERLYEPEINVALGTHFLATQMRAWGGNLPYVFSAYNAGPGRVRRWRNFPEARDRELFTERIPFAETRDYVKILTRNAALYRTLYPEFSTRRMAD